MKRIVLLLITFLFIIQLSIKPIKSFSNINTSETIGIKYTIWDDEYEETKEVRKNNASYDIDELEKIK